MVGRDQRELESSRNHNHKGLEHYQKRGVKARWGQGNKYSDLCLLLPAAFLSVPPIS